MGLGVPDDLLGILGISGFFSRARLGKQSWDAQLRLNATFNRVREGRLLADRATIVPARCRSAPDSVLVHLIGAQIWDA
jgi:hypothetical protein